MQIKIDTNGNVSFNGVTVDKNTSGHFLPQLEARLKVVLKSNSDQPIMITPSTSTPHQRVMDVLNACKGAKATKLALALL